MIRPVHVLTWAALLLGGLLLAGCADSQKAAMGDIADALERVNAALAAIERRADAEAALPQLMGLADQMVAAEQRLDALDAQGSSTRTAELEAYMDRVSAGYAELSEQMRRLERVSALEPIEPALAKMGLAPDEPAAAAR